MLVESPLLLGRSIVGGSTIVAWEMLVAQEAACLILSFVSHLWPSVRFFKSLVETEELYRKIFKIQTFLHK